jgi:hypothetical protein
MMEEGVEEVRWRRWKHMQTSEPGGSVMCALTTPQGGIVNGRHMLGALHNRTIRQ